MRGSGRKSERGGAVIIKREEIVEGGSHGGSWKIAYADFVTAMMAFFLLLWLIGATTDDQRRGIADYFAPTNIMSHGSSGSGKPFGGHTPFDPGSLVSDRGAQAVRLGVADATLDTDDPETERYHSDSPQPDVQAATTSPDDDQAKVAARASADGAPPPATPMDAAKEAAAAKDAAAQSALLANAASVPPKPDARAIDDARLRAELERREREAFDKAAEQIKEADQSFSPVRTPYHRFRDYLEIASHSCHFRTPSLVTA